MRSFIKNFALMLCALLFLFISCASWADVAINEMNFPDENFRAYVSDNRDTDDDGYLSDEEISDATYIYVSNKNIESLKGIEYFYNLKRLSCYDNQLTTLDLSKNTALTDLYAYSSITNNELIYTGNSSYPYEFDLKSIYVKDSQMSNAKNIETNIGYMTTSTNGTKIYFSSKPTYLYYDYDTQANVDDPYLIVLVTFTGVIDQSSNSNAPADDNTPNTNDNKNISPNNNNNAETINNDTEININTNSHAWRYQFDIPAGLSSAIASKFGIDPSLIFQFSDSEIISENWNLNTDDNSAINQLGEQVTIKFPIVKPSNTGVYVMRYSLENSAVGSPLKIRVVSSANSAELNTASLQNIEYAFFDENFNEITSVPENGIIYATVKNECRQYYSRSNDNSQRTRNRNNNPSASRVKSRHHRKCY